MSLAATRRVIAALILLLLVGHGVTRWTIPTLFTHPSVVEEVAKPVDNLYAQQRIERQLEAWREALAHALVQTTGIEVELAREIACGLYQTSLQGDTDPIRIAGFIVVESLGNPKAVSHKNAHGLMQILPETGKYIAYHSGGKWRGTSSLYEVKTSIEYGTWYFEHLLEEFEGNEPAAIAAYNWGPAHIGRRIRRQRGLPIVYARKVVSAQKKVGDAFRAEYEKRFWWGLDPNASYPGYDGGSDSTACPDQDPEVAEVLRAQT